MKTKQTKKRTQAQMTYLINLILANKEGLFAPEPGSGLDFEVKCRVISPPSLPLLLVVFAAAAALDSEFVKKQVPQVSR